MDYHGDIKVGYSCNNRCIFCAIAGKQKLGNRSTNQIISELKRMKGCGIDTIILSGGEPTIRKDFLELCRFVRRDLRLKLRLQTNARVLADIRIVKELKLLEIDGVLASIHGHTKELHELHTCSHGSFTETCIGISNLLSLGISTQTNTVITKLNQGDLLNITIFLAKNFPELKKIQFCFPDICGNSLLKFDEVVPVLESLSPELGRTIKYVKSKGMSVGIEDVPPCILDGHTDVIAHKKPDLYLSELDNVLAERLPESRLKAAECDACSYNSVCAGIQKQYLLLRKFHPKPI